MAPAPKTRHGSDTAVARAKGTKTKYKKHTITNRASSERKVELVGLRFCGLIILLFRGVVFLSLTFYIPSLNSFHFFSFHPMHIRHISDAHRFVFIRHTSFCLFDAVFHTLFLTYLSWPVWIEPDKKWQHTKKNRMKRPPSQQQQLQTQWQGFHRGPTHGHKGWNSDNRQQNITNRR